MPSGMCFHHRNCMNAHSYVFIFFLFLVPDAKVAAYTHTLCTCLLIYSELWFLTLISPQWNFELNLMIKMRQNNCCRYTLPPFLPPPSRLLTWYHVTLENFNGLRAFSSEEDPPHSIPTPTPIQVPYIFPPFMQSHQNSRQFLTSKGGTFQSCFTIRENPVK